MVDHKMKLCSKCHQNVKEKIPVNQTSKVVVFQFSSLWRVNSKTLTPYIPVAITTGNYKNDAIVYKNFEHDCEVIWKGLNSIDHGNCEISDEQHNDRDRVIKLGSPANFKNLMDCTLCTTVIFLRISLDGVYDALCSIFINYVR